MVITAAKNHLKKSQLTLHDGDPYKIETSLLICRPNQWTGFFMIGTSPLEIKLLVNFSLLDYFPMVEATVKSNLVEHFTSLT